MSIEHWVLLRFEKSALSVYIILVTIILICVCRGGENHDIEALKLKRSEWGLNINQDPWEKGIKNPKVTILKSANHNV